MHAIAARLALAGKTATHRGHVDALAKLVFVEIELLEPLEQRLAGGPRERLSGRSFTHARRLADQHHRRHDGIPGDDGADHVRTIVAAAQTRHVAS